MGIPRFHIVLSGECFVGSDGHDAVKAEEADIIMLPNGNPTGSPTSRVANWSRVHEQARPVNSATRFFRKGEITNRLMCGLVQFRSGRIAPDTRCITGNDAFFDARVGRAIWSVVKLIDAEMQSNENRGSRIADRLTEVLFLQLLNHYVSHSEDTTGFLAALRDRRVYRALTLIHQEPEFDWTLTSLGERVGMSRATLVRRFQEVIGVAPMAYIADWRIMKAHSLVRYSATPFEQIADSTGFASARTLSRAFQRRYGCTPNELRRSQREE